jgi:hypothetical protein
MSNAVLVQSVKNIRQIDSRIRRIGAVILLNFSVLLGLFLAKFLGFFAPPRLLQSLWCGSYGSDGSSMPPCLVKVCETALF